MECQDSVFLYVVCNVKMVAVKNDRVLGARTWQCHWVSWRGEGFRSYAGHGQKDITLVQAYEGSYCPPQMILGCLLYGDRYRYRICFFTLNST